MTLHNRDVVLSFTFSENISVESFAGDNFTGAYKCMFMRCIQLDKVICVVNLRNLLYNRKIKLTTPY